MGTADTLLVTRTPLSLPIETHVYAWHSLLLSAVSWQERPSSVAVKMCRGGCAYAPRSQYSPAIQRWPWPAGCPSRDLPGGRETAVRRAGGPAPAGCLGRVDAAGALLPTPPELGGPLLAGRPCSHAAFLGWSLLSEPLAN